jgi:Cu/Ag efflux protein CusF
MKVVSGSAFIIALLALIISVYTQFSQINEIRRAQKQITEDILELRQELPKSWPHSEEQEWPKFHDATGVLKQIAGNRVIIDQDEMPGFMRAMIMSYDVENPQQLENLKEGDKVKLKLKETETKLTVLEIVKK